MEMTFRVIESGSSDLDRLLAYLQDEALIDDNTFGVTAEGHRSRAMLVRRVVGESRTRAELFKVVMAVGTGVVRIDHAADPDQIACFEFRYCCACLGDPTDDFMAGDARIGCGHDAVPFVANRMEVGVTDPAKKNFDLYIPVGSFPAWDGI